MNTAESIIKLEQALSSTFKQGHQYSLKCLKEWLDLEYKIHSKTAGGITAAKLFKDIYRYIDNMKDG